MPYIKIEKLWDDDDGMLQIEVQASNDVLVGKQDLYIYPLELLDFVENLQEFPETINEAVKLEYGKDLKYYCYFSLRALLLDDVGHSAIEFRFDNRLDPPSKATMHFFMGCEPAIINELGRKLILWAQEMDKPFRYEWKNA